MRKRAPGLGIEEVGLKKEPRARKRPVGLMRYGVAY